MNVNLIEIEALTEEIEEVSDPEVAHSKIGEMVIEEIASWTEDMEVHQDTMIEEGKY